MRIVAFLVVAGALLSVELRSSRAGRPGRHT